MAPPLGKWLYPKSEQVAMRLISGRRVTFKDFAHTKKTKNVYRWVYMYVQGCILYISFSLKLVVIL